MSHISNRHIPLLTIIQVVFIAVLNYTQTKLELWNLRDQRMPILALVIVTKEAIIVQ